MDFRRLMERFRSSVQSLQEPGHILAEDPHGLQTLVVVFNLARVPPYADIPVVRPGMIIWVMEKKWFIESKACMAPALRTETTAAPTFRVKRSPFALAT